MIFWCSLPAHGLTRTILLPPLLLYQVRQNLQNCSTLRKVRIIERKVGAGRIFMSDYFDFVGVYKLPMANIQVVQNTFDKKVLRSLTEVLRMINFNQSREKIAEELEEVSPKQYLWAVGSNPAYFVQYQVKSAAIFKVKEHGIIVWKPKYIEYPTMVVFPEIGDKKINSMKTELDPTSTTTSYTNQKLIEYLQKFYGTHFHSDPQFQKNLVTFCKHFISKISKHSYWHVLIEDTGKLFITQISQADSLVRIRISGIKEGYDKTLVLFSYKGTRDNIFATAKTKWMQVVSFLAMIAIFYAVVACPSEGSSEGICQYRDELTMGGAGMMLALLAVRYTQKSDNKKKMRAQVQSQHEKNQ